MARRKHYIDNLRAFTVLLLFPYHIFMIYNNWGENWYVGGAELVIPSLFNRFCAFWMMPLLFTVAGISARYALQSRSTREFASERVKKLLIPFILGMLLLVPVQSFVAGLHYQGHANYFDFFTKWTDLTGYDGGATPGQLWFIIFLFVISIVSIPFFILYSKKGKGTLGDNVPLAVIVLLGLTACLGNMALDISGKSPTEDLAYFLLGYFFLSNETVLEKLERNRFWLLGLFAAGIAFTTYFDHFMFELVSWISVLTVIGMGRRYLNFSGRVTSYLSTSSFGVYLFHQSWIVITGFLILGLTDDVWMQIPLIFMGSVVLTFVTYEIARRYSLPRRMFGLKK